MVSEFTAYDLESMSFSMLAYSAKLINTNKISNSKSQETDHLC